MRQLTTIRVTRLGEAYTAMPPELNSEKLLKELAPGIDRKEIVWKDVFDLSPIAPPYHSNATSAPKTKEAISIPATQENT